MSIKVSLSEGYGSDNILTVKDFFADYSAIMNSGENAPKTETLKMLFDTVADTALETSEPDDILRAAILARDYVKSLGYNPDDNIQPPYHELVDDDPLLVKLCLDGVYLVNNQPDEALEPTISPSQKAKYGSVSFSFGANLKAYSRRNKQ